MDRKPSAIFAEDEDGNRVMQVAWTMPASDADAKRLMSRPVKGSNNRSGWVWVRFQDGTLMLGVFPEGDTYMEFSDSGVCDYQYADDEGD